MIQTTADKSQAQCHPAMVGAPLLDVLTTTTVRHIEIKIIAIITEITIEAIAQEATTAVEVDITLLAVQPAAIIAG